MSNEKKSYFKRSQKGTRLMVVVCDLVFEAILKLYG